MSDHEREPPSDDATPPGGELVLAEEGGVRVFYIAAASMQHLVDRLALVLGEHMHDYDELHVTYNAMQSGWTEHQAKRGACFARPRRAGPSCTSSTRPSSCCVPATSRPEGAARAGVPWPGGL